MRKQSNLYIFGFAIAVCLFASVVLAVASTALKPAQTQQVRLDIINNILSVSGYSEQELKGKKPAEIIDLYEKKFEVLLVDKNNEPVERSEMESELKEAQLMRQQTEDQLGEKEARLAELSEALAQRERQLAHVAEEEEQCLWYASEFV